MNPDEQKIAYQNLIRIVNGYLRGDFDGLYNEADTAKKLGLK